MKCLITKSGLSTLLISAVALVAVSACGDDAATDADTVARVDDYRLSVDEVVELLVDQEDLPVSADVVEAVSELWIDYTLFAEAMARDSTLRELDFRPLVQGRLDQEALAALGDSAIQADTVVTPEEAQAWYEASGEGVRFRARHIMLQYPPQASQEQRDSVRARLTDLRDQIRGGASFEDLARRFSQDPGSAPQGGDLGYFQPGDLVQPFEDAVNELEPGEVSDVVETPMGLHLIRLEDRQRPGFAEVSADVMERLRNQRVVQAESLYVSGVEERAGTLEVQDGAVEVARDLAANPSVRLSGRAADRTLVRWSSGALEAGRYLQLLRMEPPSFLEQVAQGDDQAIEDFLEALTRRELLLAEARVEGLQASDSRVDSLAAAAEAQVRTSARALDLVPLDRAPGEDLEPAVERAVLRALEENMTGANPPIPLGPVSYQLRQGTAHDISNAGVGRAVLELGRLRSARGSAPSETVSPDSAADPDGGGS
jgi:hypothetical protein